MVTVVVATKKSINVMSVKIVCDMLAVYNYVSLVMRWKKRKSTPSLRLLRSTCLYDVLGVLQMNVYR